MSDVLRAGWIDAEEGQVLTGYVRDHLSLLARTGRVTAQRLGGSWIFDRAALLAYKAQAKPGRKPKAK